MPRDPCHFCFVQVCVSLKVGILRNDHSDPFKCASGPQMICSIEAISLENTAINKVNTIFRVFYKSNFTIRKRDLNFREIPLDYFQNNL